MTVAWNAFGRNLFSFVQELPKLLMAGNSDSYSTTMWNGLPGMCWSPHLTTRMWFPRSLGR